MWWRRLAEVQTEHQNGEERGFKWVWTWNGCWCQTGRSEYFKNCWSTGIFTVTQLSGWKCLVDVRGQRRMGRLARDDRKATVTQITTRYNQGMQNTIFERTTHRTLKQMGYSSRRPHRVLILSAKNRKRRLQFTQAHQNWKREDWKNAWSDESWFLLQHSDGRVRIWCKEHESMDPSCLVSMVQAAGVMVWGIFSWHTLGLLVPIEHRLNATVYLSIVADHVHPFMTTVYPSSDGYFQQDNATSKSSNHLRLVSWTWQWVHFTQMASTVTRSQSSRVPLGCGGMGDSHHGCAADKSAATAWCYHVNMDQNLRGMFPKPCWIYSTKN